MKKFINKYLFLSLAACAFVACDDDNDNYEPAPAVSGEQVYFYSSQPTTFNLSAAETSFVIPVYRADKTSAVSVPVTVTAAPDSKYKCSSTTLNFAAGENKTDLLFSYNPDEIEFDVFEEITVTIDESVTNEYGVGSLTFTVGIPAPWVSLGKGTFDEDFYFGIYGEPVEIFQNEVNRNLYRIKNVIAQMLPSFGEEVSPAASEFIYFQLLHPGDVILDQGITQEGLVFFYSDGPHSSVHTGYVHPSYNDDLCIVFPGIFTSKANPEEFWQHNRVLGYKEDGTPGAVQLAGNYYMFNTGGFGGDQDDNDIIITFPGYVIADYSAEVKALGRFVDTKERGQAVFGVTLGGDVANAKVAMAAGKDAMVAYQMILDGDESVLEITASGEVRFAYDEPGDYVCVVATYDADGNEQDVVYALINIPAGGAEEVETFEAVYAGIYSHGVDNLSNGNLPFGQAFDDEALLYVSTSDDSRWMISPWINMGYEDNDTEGQGMLFIWDEEGNITVPGSFCGVPTSYGDMWAWDLVTAEVANLPCKYDPQSGFHFYLAWSVEAGDFGYTHDVYVPTAYASAPAKKAAMSFAGARNIPAAKQSLLGKHNLAKKLNADTLSARASKRVSATSGFKTFAK